MWDHFFDRTAVNDFAFTKKNKIVEQSERFWGRLEKCDNLYRLGHSGRFTKQFANIECCGSWTLKK